MPYFIFYLDISTQKCFKSISLAAKLVNALLSGIIILNFGNDFNHDFFDDLLEAKT